MNGCHGRGCSMLVRRFLPREDSVNGIEHRNSLVNPRHTILMTTSLYRSPLSQGQLFPYRMTDGVKEDVRHLFANSDKTSRDENASW